MDVRTHTLVAGARTRIHQTGRFFKLIKTAAALDVTFERRGSPVGEVALQVEAGYTRFPGNWANPKQGVFDTVVLSSASAQTVTVALSNEAGDYDRFAAVVQLEQPSTITTGTDSTSSGTVNILPADLTRTGAILKNVGTVNIRVGGTIGATRGIPLKPGESVFLDSTALISWRPETGTGVCSATSFHR